MPASHPTHAPRAAGAGSLRTLCVGLLVALAAWLAGCASPTPKAIPGQFVDADFAPPPKGSLVLVLHLPASERAYRHGDYEALAMVQDFLVRNGYRVAVIEPDDHAIALQAELRPLLDQNLTPTPAQLQRAELKALALVARVTADLSGSRLLLRTRLLTRPASLWQSHANWDGVSRPIGFTGTPPGRVAFEIEGTGTGVSIEATAISGAGRLLFRTFGGIALPFETDFRGLPVPASRLFTRGFLEEGVHTALVPLHPR